MVQSVRANWTLWWSMLPGVKSESILKHNDVSASTIIAADQPPILAAMRDRASNAASSGNSGQMSMAKVCAVASPTNGRKRSTNAAMPPSIRRDQCIGNPYGAFMRHCVVSNQDWPFSRSRTPTRRIALSVSMISMLRKNVSINTDRTSQTATLKRFVFWW